MFKHKMLPPNFQKFINKELTKLKRIGGSNSIRAYNPKGLLQDLISGAEAALEKDEEQKAEDKKKIIIDNETQITKEE